MFEFLHVLIISLFLLSSFGYILVIVKEKLYMKKNVIMIENKHLTREDLDEIEMNIFLLKGKSATAGDEIKVITSDKEKINGTFIGVNYTKGLIHVITFKNKIEKLKIDNILKFKVTSKYGKFLNY